MCLMAPNLEAMKTRKFMQTLNDKYYQELSKVAAKRGISLQDLIRGTIIPEWAVMKLGDLEHLPLPRQVKIRERTSR